MSKWIYHIELFDMDSGPNKKELDELGDKGWELVQMMATNIGIFKRPKTMHEV